jgi:hypothetical protein
MIAVFLLQDDSGDMQYSASNPWEGAPKYSENYFDVGIIAVEITRAGPTTTVIFFLYLDICGPCSTVTFPTFEILFCKILFFRNFYQRLLSM